MMKYDLMCALCEILNTSTDEELEKIKILINNEQSRRFKQKLAFIEDKIDHINNKINIYHQLEQLRKLR